MRDSISAGWLLVTILLGGCGAAASPVDTTDITQMVATPQKTSISATSTFPPVSPAGCAAGDIDTADESAVLTLGPAEGIPATTAEGEPMTIAGVVLDQGCQPVSGATLHVWQTDGDGVYGPGHETNNLECCYLQGEVTTDGQGRFRLISVRPGHYKGTNPPPPAHIHVEGQGQAQGLMTEIVFAGDPYLPASHDGLTVVSLTKTDGVTWSGVAVILLEKS